jgi:hypothetical protein
MSVVVVLVFCQNQLKFEIPGWKSGAFCVADYIKCRLSVSYSRQMSSTPQAPGKYEERDFRAQRIGS